MEKPIESSFFDRFKLEMQSIVQTLIIAIVAILAIVLVLRPAVNQLIAQSQSASTRVAAELSALEGGAQQPGRLPSQTGPGGAQAVEEDTGFNDTMIDVANIKGGMKASTMQKMNDIIEQHPEETMGVLRKWVAQS